MRLFRRSVIVAVAVGALFVGVSQVFGDASNAGTAPDSAPDPFASYVTPTGPEISQQQAAAIAEQEALRSGDPDPGVSVGTGTLEAAMRTTDHSFNLPEPSTSPGYSAMLQSSVYFVVMTGRFRLPNARVKAGSGLPTGSMLVLVIDAHTGDVEGRALPTPQEQSQDQAMQLASVSGPTFIKVQRVTGTVLGVLHASGGPTGRATTGGASHVSVTAIRARRLLKTVTGKDGTFQFHLTPGRYWLSGHRLGACLSKNVVVRAAQTTRVSLTCSVR